jgi:hypothetical protein
MQAPELITILALELLPLCRIEHSRQPRPVQNFKLGGLGRVDVSRLGNRRLLLFGRRPLHHPAVGVTLLQPIHRDFQRGSRFFIVAHHASVPETGSGVVFE